MTWVISTFRLLLTISLVMLGFYFLRPTERVLWQSCQPIYLLYSNDVHYCATIIEGGYNLNFFTGRVKRGTFLFVGSEADKVTTGHMMEYSFQIGDQAPEIYYPQLQSQWSIQGVKISEPTGHSLFIPSTAYTGSVQ